MKTYNSWLLIQQVETWYKHDLCKKIAALFHDTVSKEDRWLCHGTVSEEHGSTVVIYIPGDVVTH